MVMSFVHGCPADLTWFEPSGLDTLEEWRVKILESLAGAMSQLQELEFNHGALLSLGLWDLWNKGLWRVLKVEEFGSFTSSQAYLQYCLASRPDGEIYRNPSINAGAQKILDMAISCLPHFTTDESADATFVVGLPDFNWQNIMTDDAGNVTSIVDWDNVQTKTGRLWYSTIPRWIATDWNPALYRLSTYPLLEHSLERLGHYQEFYRRKMEEVLQTVDSKVFTEIADLRCRFSRGYGFHHPCP
ncbi:uncharacterized protein CIMG_11685 [Coccidioides immitis RS]|uniref:Aminoglycoside phosphotransferase domain-containing protein n=2 Tax=Coccidioides immitis TaxID=5501 RepID=A0A0D8JT33_COCIM|nr:uncharacterized protein CIMG_11685 [Coccidioides immitis RS]KJF60515.1 hypothetical protein CIMG_11685 [Coccidioides immitis RS]